MSLFDKGILGPDIRPSCGQIGQLAALGQIIHPPLPPAPLTINQFEGLAATRMKRMSDREALLRLVGMGCSAHP